MKSLREFRDKASSMECMNMAVARAEDKAVLEAVAQCYSENIINPILVGNEKKIENLLDELNIDSDFRIIDAETDKDVIMKIITLVENGEVAGIISVS